MCVDARNEQFVTGPIKQIDRDNLKSIVGRPQMLARDEPAVEVMYFEPVALVPASASAIVRRTIFPLVAPPLDDAQSAACTIIESNGQR